MRIKRKFCAWFGHSLIDTQGRPVPVYRFEYGSCVRCGLTDEQDAQEDSLLTFGKIEYKCFRLLCWIRQKTYAIEERFGWDGEYQSLGISDSGYEPEEFGS